jgi:DNA mismatch endonuclease, patch repair protein
VPDLLTPERRSENMRRIRSKGMKPEMTVRKLAHRMGYRYSLHSKKLPGRPDLIFVSRRKVIFVHGCFWHQHSECREGRVPGSRRDYWVPKLARNVERDRRNIEELQKLCLVLWECETNDLERLRSRIASFLGPSRSISASALNLVTPDVSARVRRPRRMSLRRVKRHHLA